MPPQVSVSANEISNAGGVRDRPNLASCAISHQPDGDIDFAPHLEKLHLTPLTGVSGTAVTITLLNLKVARVIEEARKLFIVRPPVGLAGRMSKRASKFRTCLRLS